VSLCLFDLRNLARENEQSETSAKHKLWFTYLLSALVCFWSKGAWSLYRCCRNVKVFHFSNLCDQEAFPKFNQFFLVRRYVCSKIFTKQSFGSFYAKFLTEGQTEGITKVPNVKNYAEFLFYFFFQRFMSFHHLPLRKQIHMIHIVWFLVGDTDIDRWRCVCFTVVNIFILVSYGIEKLLAQVLWWYYAWLLLVLLWLL